jgi:hypothetical protein
MIDEMIPRNRKMPARERAPTQLNGDISAVGLKSCAHTSGGCRIFYYMWYVAMPVRERRFPLATSPISTCSDNDVLISAD